VWRHIAESLQGPSHVVDGTCCQDSNGVCLLGEKAAATLVACVADGAGSARFSNVGARIACDTVLENATNHFHEHGHFDGFEREDAIGWCDDIHARIEAESRARECAARDLATTLLVAIAGPRSASFFQIGDGGIVVRNHGVYGIVFWPQTGEYANSTNFVTSEDYRDRLDHLSICESCSDIALLTDGLERLALSFHQQTPHAPFFEPLFNALRTTNDLPGLSEGLRAFLGSTSVRNRSEDDKTLIIASREHA
jgi:hypothetical protein